MCYIGARLSNTFFFSAVATIWLTNLANTVRLAERILILTWRVIPLGFLFFFFPFAFLLSYRLIYMHSGTKYNSCLVLSATLIQKAWRLGNGRSIYQTGLVEQEKRSAHRTYPLLPPQSLEMLSQAELTKMLWPMPTCCVVIYLVLFFAFSY